MQARGTGRGARLVTAALVVTLAGSLGGSPAQAAADEEPEVLTTYRTFSPNGDGVRDRVTIRYRLPAATTVRIRVEPDEKTKVAPFVVRLGRQAAGRHRWRWNGRTPRGRLVPEGGHRIHVVTPQGSDQAYARADLTFDASVHVLERYGARKKVTPKVYPRSVEVRDAVPLGVAGWSDGVRRVVATFRDDDGRVVLRRKVRLQKKWLADLGWEGRDARGRPLPAGRYSVTVSGVDVLGNRGSSTPLALYVSRDRLVLREETRTLTAEEAWTPPCFSSSWPDCTMFLPQGEVVPSTRFPGGLSHRADPTEENGAAVSSYFVEVPEAVRGLEAIRVAFTGEPTTSGEPDPGRLTTEASPDDEDVVTSSSGARTEWDETPVFGQGQSRDDRSRRLPPGAWWRFWTDGDDAFDVATFTLDLRYLAVEPS